MGGRHWRGLHELGDQAEGKTYREDGVRLSWQILAVAACLPVPQQQPWVLAESGEHWWRGGAVSGHDQERRGDAAGGSACASHASPRIRGVSWRQQRAAPSPTMSAPRERGVASEGT
ncbi:unnamed protein product [Lampetra fluviatilis]